LVTSRPHDYLDRLESFPHFDLCPFNDDEIQQFIGGWSRVHESDAAKAADRATALWSALEAHKEIKDLAETPLLLAMIVRVHFVSGVLPDGRCELYRHCTDMLLHHWAVQAGRDQGSHSPGPKEKVPRAACLRIAR
jgi:predicted NACHT family NTPase